MVYIRHCAWLHAVPGKAKEPRIASRPDAPMPPVDWGAHLIGYLFEAGPVNSGGMGPVPLTDRDILAWRENQGVDLTPWEAGLLIRLSRAYCNGLSEYATATAPPPWTPPIDEVKAKQATNAFADWAKRMASR